MSNVFFSKNENKFRKNKDSKLSYFKDRNKIGLISTNIQSLVKNVYKISKNQKKFTRKIFRLRKKRIKYINMSLEITTKFIKRIVNSESERYPFKKSSNSKSVLGPTLVDRASPRSGRAL